MNKVKELSVEEMDLISEKFKEIFPSRGDITFLHEFESKYVHTDIGIIDPSKENQNYIAFTMGTSNSVMPNGKRFEIFTQIPNDLFIETPKCEICESGKSLKETINNMDYAYILNDLITISKMPAIDNDDYNAFDTIETNNRIYGLIPFTQIAPNFDIFYLTYLSMEELSIFKRIKDINKIKKFLVPVPPIKLNKEN